MKIVTYNIRCVYDGDGINAFIHRVGLIYDKIKAETPDVIAFQEVIPQILEMLEKLLPEYVFVGQGRDAEYTGEGLYTAIRKDTCQLLGFETIWLSPTPYTPESRYESQSNFPRIVVQSLVREKESGRIFRLYNVHLDHKSDEARVQGMQCALDFAAQQREKDGYPMVLLGDFNARPDSKVIALCDAHGDLKQVTENIEVTFHKYGERAIKIDYIYMSAVLSEQVRRVYIWDEVHEGIYLSDHYPICAEI